MVSILKSVSEPNPPLFAGHRRGTAARGPPARGACGAPGWTPASGWPRRSWWGAAWAGGCGRRSRPSVHSARSRRRARPFCFRPGLLVWFSAAVSVIEWVGGLLSPRLFIWVGRNQVASSPSSRFYQSQLQAARSSGSCSARAPNKFVSLSESQSESISTAALLATARFLGIAGQKFILLDSAGNKNWKEQKLYLWQTFCIAANVIKNEATRDEKSFIPWSSGV